MLGSTAGARLSYQLIYVWPGLCKGTQSGRVYYEHLKSASLRELVAY